MKAVLLAGGRGTRLGALTERLPKPMVPIDGTPLLEHQIGVLKRYGVRDIILSIGYRAGVIENYFGDGSRFGVSIGYAVEIEPLGTAGALKQLEGQLTEDFLVVYGDVLFDMNLERLFRFHEQTGGAGVLVLHPNDHPADSDLVEIDPETRRTVAFHPKPHAPGSDHRNLVNAGTYLLSPRVLEAVEPGTRADLGRNVFPRIVGAVPLHGYVTAEYLKDMGTPERLAQVTRDFVSGKVHRFNNEHPRRAAFLDRDGVLNRHVGLVHRPEQIELLPGVAEGIRALNDSDYLTIVVTNQPVVARGLCSLRDVERIHGRLESLLARHGAKLDAIYYCPHHPDRGYPEEDPRFKVACACRKPGTLMIERAVNEFNVQLEGSFLIGDAARDVQCGRRAGLTTLGVRTGEVESLRNCPPDFEFVTFAHAVTYILDGAVNGAPAPAVPAAALAAAS